MRRPSPRRWLARLPLVFAICGLPDYSACPGGSVLIKSYGYIEIRPPSQLFSPGGMIVMLHHSPLEAAFVCGPRGSLGADLVVQRSRTMGQSLSKINHSRFEMEAKFLESVRGDARFKSIDKIVMEIDNARIEELRDEDVLNGAQNRSQECVRALSLRLAQGFKPTMISSALSGDMRFYVHWSKELHVTAKAKVETLSQLAIEMGGGVTSVTESEIRAENLVFGIRVSSYLAELSMVPDREGPILADLPQPRPSVEIHNTRRIYIDPVPEAPVVTPASYDPSRDGWVEDESGRRFLQPLRSLREGAPLFAPRRPPTMETLGRRTKVLSSPSNSLDPQETDSVREALKRAVRAAAAGLGEGIGEGFEEALGDFVGGDSFRLRQELEGDD